ncbi:hypothetical protein QBC46DRAFT_293839 [Diplogelasinospora grovesii]|uniref:Uncharacterized protein n=1 Tax=Diplogelasinospora grovesii TaxID=303347 RepID=A0AAN6N3D8_9PEZI|nr:hypothetical protein QBC46DRAFT_293839 [Diplogelasinospora grovesii]
MWSTEGHTHLGDQINIATRSAHTHLNKQILLRLPLAIPPRAHDPSVYGSGLLHIAPIYLTFESLWGHALQLRPADDDEEEDIDPKSPSPEPFPPLCDDGSGEKDDDKPICRRIHAVLGKIRLPGLARSASLLADIRTITGWSEELVEEQVQAVANTGGLREFIDHIRRSVEMHPEVLIAYAWVLYMALFSGGRFIRGSLETAGADFWCKPCEPIRPSGIPCKKEPPEPRTIAIHEDRKGSSSDDSVSCVDVHYNKPPCSTPAPLAFFRFDTPQDGEDLKTEFKRRLLESESLLTSAEEDHVVQEAISIFDNMILLVTQLDGAFSNRSPSNSLDGWATLLVPRVGSRLRDSVAMAKERSLKALSRASQKISSKSDRSSNGCIAEDLERGRTCCFDRHDEADPAEEKPPHTASGKPSTSPTTRTSTLLAYGTMTHPSTSTQSQVAETLLHDPDALVPPLNKTGSTASLMSNKSVRFVTPVTKPPRPSVGPSTQEERHPLLLGRSTDGTGDYVDEKRLEKDGIGDYTDEKRLKKEAAAPRLPTAETRWENTIFYLNVLAVGMLLATMGVLTLGVLFEKFPFGVIAREQ